MCTKQNSFDDERSFCSGVDAFCVEMARFEAIFGLFQKIVHNSFKNQAIGMGLPPPNCMKAFVSRHVKLTTNG
jgi:hypothetical protein